MHAGWVAKSKLLAPVHIAFLAPVHIAFLFILDHRFIDYDKEVFHLSIKGSTHLSNSFIIGFTGSSGVTDRLQSRTYLGAGAKECHRGQVKRERLEKETAEERIYFGGYLKTLYMPSSIW